MRLGDWETRLDAYVESRRYAPFRWGSNDCCLFAAGAVAAMTGQNYAQLFPDYYLRCEAESIMGTAGVEGIACSVLGEAVPPHRLRKGDLGLVETQHGLGVAVVLGLRGALPGPTGLVFPARDEFRKGWRV